MELDLIDLVGELEDQKGRIWSVAKNNKYYPELEVHVLSPKYYYNKRHGDKYSLQILDAKRRVDLSAYFWDELKNTIDEDEGRLKIDECEFITVIPSSKPNMPITPTIFSLAFKLSKHLKIPYEQIIIKIDCRKREGSSCDERYKAVKGTMEIKGKSVAGKKILLLDDVRTSGIHILECSKILIEAGAKWVVCLCLGTHTSDTP